MKITSESGITYELIGKKEGLHLYGPCDHLGIVMSAHIGDCKQIQIKLKQPKKHFKTVPYIINTIEGDICVETSDLCIFFSGNKRNIYVDFGHKKGVLKAICNIEVGSSLVFIYSILSDEGIETKKMQKFSSSHPIQKITTT